MNTKREESLKLLKRLSEVGPRWFYVEWENAARCGHGVLWVDEEGQIQGGDVLWFMFSEMRERYKAIILGTEASTQEHAVLESFMRKFSIPALDADYVTEGYINWKEAVQSATTRIGEGDE